MHYDAFNSYQAVPNILRRYGSGLRYADTVQYQQPRCRTAISERAFSYTRPHAWKALPPSLHTITDSKQFRKQLKTCYFSREFCDNVMQTWTSRIIIFIIIIVMSILKTLNHLYSISFIEFLKDPSLPLLGTLFFILYTQYCHI